MISATLFCMIASSSRISIMRDASSQACSFAFASVSEPPPSESGFVAFQDVYEAVAERREQVVFDVVGRAQVASVGAYLDENILDAVFYQFPVVGELGPVHKQHTDISLENIRISLPVSVEKPIP